MGLKLFFGRAPGAPANAAAEVAPGGLEGTPGRSAPELRLPDAPRPEAELAPAGGPEGSGAWMGALFGSLGRIKKAAAAAILGAVALGSVSTGAALAAEPVAPEPEAALAGSPTTRVANPGATRPYEVKRGDNMWRIAKDHGVDPRVLVAMNPQIANPALIYPGQVVQIPVQAPAPTPVPTPAPAPRVEVPVGPGAGPGSGLLTPSVESPAPDAPTPKNPTEERSPALLRDIRKLTFDLLKDQKLDQSKSFELAEGVTATAKVKAVFLDSAVGDWQRMAFERTLPEGKAALWLQTQGEASVDGARAAPAAGGWSVSGKGAFSYELVRPHVYAKADPDPLKAARALVENIYTFPLSADAASALTQGSTFQMQATAKLNADGKLSFGTVKAGANGDLSLSVRRMEGQEVQVTYARSRGVEAVLDANGLRDGAVDVDLSVKASGARSQLFSFDLAQPAAREAYSALMRLSAGKAEDLAKVDGHGVRLMREDDTASRGVQGSVRYKPDGTLDVTVRGGVQQDRDGEDKTTTVQGGFDAAVKPEEDGLSARIKADASRVVKPQERLTTVTGEVAVSRPLSERTEVSSTLRASHRHEVDERWDEEVRAGTLAHRGVFSTKLMEASGKPVTLGFDADQELGYKYTTPVGFEGPLPTTAALMKAAPKGAELELTGEGKVGMDAQRRLDNLDLAFDTSAHGSLSVTATRLAEDEVRVEVRLEKGLEAGGKVTFTHAADGAKYTASFQDQEDWDAEKSASFTLSLDRPAHQAAYVALLKGNMGPASRLLDAPGPSWVKSRSSTQTVKLNAGPVEWLDAGLEVVRRDVDPQDARIRWSSDRRAFTEAAEARGQKVRWIEAEGAFAPKVSYTGSAPVAGGVGSWRHGFATDAMLRYRAFAPSVDGAGAELQPALTSAAARAMPRGSEFELTGKGNLTGFTGLGVGYEWGATGVTASLSASADAKQTASRTWDVKVVRLDGDRVEVSLERGKGSRTAFELAARAGVKVDSAELLGLESALEQVALLGKLTDKLDDQLDKRLAFELQASWSKAKDSSDRITFELDLANPAAAKAYEALVGLDAKAAMALADGAGPAPRPSRPALPAEAAVVAGEAAGVKITRGWSTESVQKQEHLHVDAFGERLYLRDALRKDEVTIDRWDGANKRTDRSTFREQYEGLLGRKQDMSWEAVRVRTPEDPVGKGYYRLQYTDQDPLTSKSEVRRLVSLGQDLGAQPAHDARIENGARGLAKLLGSWAKHGKTKLEMDVFFTQKGIDQVRKLDSSQALAAYGEVAARRDGREAYGWTMPGKAERAIKLLEQHKRVKHEHFGRNDGPDEKRGIEVEYWRLTGNELWEDDDAYASAKAFAAMVGRMHASQDPVEWNKAFADLGEALSFDFYDALATLQKIAGTEELLVHQLQMKGKAVDIEMKDEGLLRYPG